MATDSNESDGRFSDPYGSTGSSRPRNLVNASIDEDFAEAMERLTSSQNTNTYADLIHYIDDIFPLVHDKCHHLRNTNNLSRGDAKLLFKLGPVLRVVVDSHISPDWGDEPNMAQNQYELKARRFLYGFEYVLDKYLEIYNEEYDSIGYTVDEDFVDDWYRHINPDPEQDQDRGEMWRWSWSDECWINCNDEQ